MYVFIYIVYIYYLCIYILYILYICTIFTGKSAYARKSTSLELEAPFWHKN